jgi:hypothetical protein
MKRWIDRRLGKGLAAMPYALFPPAACILLGMSPPDRPLSFGLAYSVFFAYSEFGILVLAADSGEKSFSGMDLRIRFLFRALIFPSFAFMLLLADGQERSATALSCLFAAILTAAAESLRSLALRKFAILPSRSFASSLAFAVLASIAGYALGLVDVIFALGAATTILLVASLQKSRSSAREDSGVSPGTGTKERPSVWRGGSE